jgi:hypothetical protein
MDASAQLHIQGRLPTNVGAPIDREWRRAHRPRRVVDRTFRGVRQQQASDARTSCDRSRAGRRQITASPYERDSDVVIPTGQLPITGRY